MNRYDFSHLKITLILLWYIILTIAVLQCMMSTMFLITICDDEWDYHEYYPIAVMYLIHAITKIISSTFTIYGIKKCDHWLCLFGCIWIVIIMAQLSWLYLFCNTQFLIYSVIISFGYMLCLFMLNIKFTYIIANGKHEAFIIENQIITELKIIYI